MGTAAQTEDKLAGTAMIRLFQKRKSKNQNTYLFRNTTTSGGQKPAIIAFRRVFLSTFGIAFAIKFRFADRAALRLRSRSVILRRREKKRRIFLRFSPSAQSADFVCTLTGRCTGIAPYFFFSRQ